jgi:hypothetical protein
LKLRALEDLTEAERVAHVQLARALRQARNVKGKHHDRATAGI